LDDYSTTVKIEGTEKTIHEVHPNGNFCLPGVGNSFGLPEAKHAG